MDEPVMAQNLTPEPSRPTIDAVPATVVTAPAAGRQTALWVLTVVLAVIATALVMRWDDSAYLRTALAQHASGYSPAGARGIYAFTGQLTAKTYGLFMMD